ncbi:MAG: McrB family protein, partial [Campylobacterales bacterium]
MNLTKDKLKSLFNGDYFNRKSEIADRFDKFCEFLSDKCEIIEDELEPFYYNIQKNLLGFNFRANIGNIKREVNEPKEQFDSYLYFIGGIENLNTLKFEDKYRLISNSQNDYSGSLSSGGVFQKPNSNFITNNTPSVICKFIELCKEEREFKAICKDSKIVISWPEDIDVEVGKQYRENPNDENEQKLLEISSNKLETKFITKFLWMLANRESVVHPISLMAFRNFLDSDFGKEMLGQDCTPESVTNMKLDDFKEAWKNISDKILESLAVEVNPENIKNISKLISQICIEETDIKNISDLLTTGNRAVILWGPPGTGKTYESEAVVKELLEVSDDEEFEERYLFSKGDMSRNDKGYYEIVQFHSNYTYQDFIGGISPKLDGDNNIGYELREGVFKRFCDEASKKENEQKKFIFIIDEINRAELSAVFGELLYALEYRGKSINLPHFGEFTIPKNLYIIGTMNNVDKSLVTFDLALRRRFGFFKLMPKLEVMQEVL